MSDERPDSLAAQAAAWVPPWERQQVPLDRAYPDSLNADDSAPDDSPDQVSLNDDQSEPSADQESEPLIDQESERLVDQQSEPSADDQSEPVVDQQSVVEAAYAAGVADLEQTFAPNVQPLSQAERDREQTAATARETPAETTKSPPTPDATADQAQPAVPAQARAKRGEKLTNHDTTSRTVSEVDRPELDDVELAAALEAVLLVVDEPVGELRLAQVLEQPAERIAIVLTDISARYTAAGHGFDLRRAAGGWRLYTRAEYAAYVERFVLDGQTVRLTQAALETLAVVAYKQPVTRSRISAIRGVNCDGVMRTLTTRGLIEECGTEGETGAYLYRTTVLFLEKLGLNSVDQLPPLAPFLPDDVEEVLDASG